jgi:CSLREA domain-containing protein
MLGSNGNNRDDRIILATNGTYNLTTLDNTTEGPSGLPIIGYDQGHQLTIVGNGSTIKRDPNAPDFRIFTIDNQGFTNGAVEIDNLIIANGNAGSGDQTASHYGGGIYSSTMLLTLDNCTMLDNIATQGGGLANEAAVIHVNNCTFSGNFGTFRGSAAYSDTFTRSSSVAFTWLVFTNCTFSGNFPSESGALYNFSGHLSNGAGALAKATFNSCTLDGNGILDWALPGGTAETHLDNTILNQSPLTLFSAGGVANIFSDGYNLSSDDGGGFLTQPTDQTNTDPGFDPLGLRDNGGPTQTIALTNNSPALDKGNSFGSIVDQRGGVRPYDNPSIPNANGGDGSDIGAYEAIDAVQGGANLVVTTTGDHDDGVCGGADCSLREAVARANSVPGANTIIFAHTLSGSITLTMGELDVTDSLTITGIPIGTISGNNASRVFKFSGGSSYLYGLTIRDGFNQMSNFLGQTNTGGGISNGATLSIYGCSFINNRVLGGQNVGIGSNGGTGEGGAIYNSGTLLVDSSTFMQTNSASGTNGGNGNFTHGGVASGSGGAGRGGAVFNEATGSLTITNCTFNGNVALGGTGGSGGPFGGNGGNGDGGAIYNLGTLTIKSATVNGNSGGGGAAGTGTTNGTPGRGSNGVTADDGAATVANTIIAGNIYVNGRNDDVDGAFSSSGYNLIGNGDFSTGFNAAGDQAGTTAAPINPQLGPLQNNGGATQTMVPQSNSAALDRGFAFGLTNDQRGHARPFDDPAIANAPGGDGSDIGAVEIGSGPAPTLVVSRKMHVMNNQVFDVALSADTLGDECRSGGANGDYTVIFTFAAPVTFTSASVCTGTGMVVSASANSNQVTVNLTGVTSAEVLNICLSNVSDGTTGGNVSFPFRVLVGDTTGNGSVNASDVSQTKSKSGQPVDASNFRNDVTVNNSINASDVSLVKSRSGTALP